MRRLLLAFALMCACTPAKSPQGSEAAHYAACNAKGKAITQLPLKCSDRLELLKALVQEDTDCKAVFGDTVPDVSCKDPNSYPAGQK